MLPLLPLLLALVFAAVPAAAGEALTVAVIGDSFAVGIGHALASQRDPRLAVSVLGVEGTGLAGTRRYDWPTEAERRLVALRPALVIISIGTNDAGVALDGARFGTPAWEVSYRRRVHRLLGAVAAAGSAIIWLTPRRRAMPNSPAACGA